MTLSLDDVRNKRFRMARKSGYEVLEVDEFVDEVEEAFAQLTEENDSLKKQVDALRQPSAAPTSPSVSGQPAPSGAATPLNAVVVTTSKEASSAVVRLVELSTDQAERLVAEATADAKRIREEADRNAAQLTGDAQTKAERLESEAQANVDRLRADATARVEKVDKDLEQRRMKMFGELERQREQLSTSVKELRAFEAAYRANLTKHLRGQIEAVESHRAEPTPVPDVLGLRSGTATGDNGAQGEGRPPAAEPGQGGAGSSTPRLDALLGDQR